ncbi:MAG: GMC oxidoreductase [Saprospiraceae bacterium]
MEKMYDYVIVGSGFGGSVSALRLAEKGYHVLVIEKGKWFNKPKDFPKTNWNLRKWLWVPSIGWKGLFNLSFFRHVTVVSGTGVGGGSLVYANTLPIPKRPFFESGSWKGLQDWEKELKPFYEIAKKMLGAAPHPYTGKSEKVLQELARQLGNSEGFNKTDVAVYFGKIGKEVKDPYFDGKGPSRTGCNLCGGCMLGCRYNAKNTLDKNYLYLAQQLGTEIQAEHIVTDVKPLDDSGSLGYEIFFKNTFSKWTKTTSVKTKGVIFAGGVLGTLSLLHKIKKDSLPLLSDRLGKSVRTNSESLIGVTSFDKSADFSEGIAIGSMIQLDENRHIEPVKYPKGSGFWRIFMAPMVRGNTFFHRLGNMIKDWFYEPKRNLKALLIADWAKSTQILLFMESIESTLSMKRSFFGFLRTKVERGKSPTSYNPLAYSTAKKVETIIDGKAMVMNTESLLGIPTTAHILGGACMGKDDKDGVINHQNKVFNYENMLICDGSMISANIGVNPSLTITAISERAMSLIPNKEMKNEF